MAALPESVAGFEEVETLVIGDGCTDRTAEVARACGATRVHDRKNHAGLAATFREGLAIAREMGADVVVNFDADNQYPAEKIPEMTALILSGEADVVIGERTFAQTDPLKRFMQLFASRLASLIAGVKVRDVASGFRAYNQAAMDRTIVKGSYTYTMETTLNIRHAGLRLATIQVDTNPDLRSSRLIKSKGQYMLQAGRTIVCHLLERITTSDRVFPAEWLVAGATFVACGLLATHVFQGTPVSADEHAYLVQAHVFASGKTHQYLPSLHPVLRDLYFQWVDGRYFSKYAPGYPVALAVGVLLGCAQLVNPFIAAASVFFLIRLVSTFTSRSVAVMTGLIVATNPYFWGYAASFYSQSLTLFCAISALYSLRLYEIRGGDFNLIKTGIAMGVMMATRPLDAFCLFLVLTPLLVSFVVKRGRYWDLIRFVQPAAIVIAFLLLYNVSLTGKLSIAAYPAFESDFILLQQNSSQSGILRGFMESAKFWYSNAANFGVNLFTVQFVGFSCFGLPALALAGFLIPGHRLWKILCSLQLGFLVFFYFFHYGSGWPQYGSRYYYSSIVGLSVLAGIAIHELSKYRSIIVAVFLVFLIFFQGAIGLERIIDYQERFERIHQVNLQIASQCPDGSIVILGDQRPGGRWPPYVYLFDFKRNNMRNDRRVIVRNQQEYNAITGQYPSRTPCYFSDPF